MSDKTPTIRRSRSRAAAGVADPADETGSAIARWLHRRYGCRPAPVFWHFVVPNLFGLALLGSFLAAPRSWSSESLLTAYGIFFAWLAVGTLLIDRDARSAIRERIERGPLLAEWRIDASESRALLARLARRRGHELRSAAGRSFLAAFVAVGPLGPSIGLVGGLVGGLIVAAGLAVTVFAVTLLRQRQHRTSFEALEDPTLRIHRDGLLLDDSLQRFPWILTRASVRTHADGPVLQLDLRSGPFGVEERLYPVPRDRVAQARHAARTLRRAWCSDGR